jgi:hypothetical protein
VPESKIQTSFAAGELSPNLYARVDLDKFTVGAALLRNFLVDWRGGASNRPGTQYCGIAKSLGARLIPFEFSTDVTYMLEFGNHYVRFYHDGLRVLINPLPIIGITNANPAVVNIANAYNTGDWVVLYGIPDMPQLNGIPVVATYIDNSHFSIATPYGEPVDSTSWPAYTSGGTGAMVYELQTPYGLQDVFQINYTQSADVITLVHPLYPPYDLSRVDATPTFDLVPETVGPKIDPPTNLVGAPTSIGNAHNYGYVVTAVNEKGTEESLPSNPTVVPAAILDQIGDTATGVPVTVINLTWEAPAQTVSAYNIYKWGPVLNASGVPATIFGYIGQTKATAFQDANFAPDYSKTPNDFSDPFAPGQILSVNVTDGGSGYTGSYVNLTFAGDGSGAEGYAIVDYASGKLVAAVVVEGGQDYTYVTVTTGGGPATLVAEIGPPSGTYPSVVSFVQQRRAFAAPLNNPEGIELSQIGQYNNFNSSPIEVDSDAITLDLASGEVNYIRSMVPMSTGLLILSSGGAFLLSGGGPGTPLTPSNVTATKQASHGANFLPALGINYDALYMQNKGNTVRDIAFNFYLQSYVGSDRSTLAAHLFEDYTFVEWAWAQEPLKIVVAVRGDGVLLTMTYVPEQEVYGWAHHDTQGMFQSVAVVSEGIADAIYVIVRRFIPNTPAPGWYDIVERFSNRDFDCLFDDNMWFLDCAVQNPKTHPDTTLYLAQSGDTVTGTIYAPSTRNTFLTSYVISAEENYDPRYVTQFNAGEAAYYSYADDQLLGHGYDHVARKLRYPAIIGNQVDGEDQVNNETNLLFWSGKYWILPSPVGTWDVSSQRNLFIAEKNLDTGQVVFWDTYNSAFTVPSNYLRANHAWVAGSYNVNDVVDGSDNNMYYNTVAGNTTNPVGGTGWTLVGPDTEVRRFVDDTSNYGANTPLLTDPRTGDVWVHMQSCELYSFQQQYGYAQVISPLFPVGNINNAVMPVGLSMDWLYACEYEDSYNFPAFQLYLVPPNYTVSGPVDYLVASHTYAYPQFCNITRHCMHSDGTLYVIQSKDDIKNYSLYKVDPASGFVDVTPWTSTTGPNSNVSAYSNHGSHETPTANEQVSLFHLPATNGLVMLTKLRGEDLSPANYNGFRVDCTYVHLGTTLTYEYHEGFVTSYMDENWEITTAGSEFFNPIGYVEFNPYLDLHDFIFSDVDYTKRWFMFYGSLVSDPDSYTRAVFVEYLFVAGQAPQVQRVIFEKGWDDAYPDYMAVTAPQPVITGSTPLLTTAFNRAANYSDFVLPDMGLYDAVTDSFWLSGGPNSGQEVNFFHFDPAYLNRIPNDTTLFSVSPPLMKLNVTQLSPIQGITTNCALINVTTLDAYTFTGTLVFGELAKVPGDPNGALLPAPAGTWAASNPVSVMHGLNHLEGKEVMGVADGRVVGPFTVVNGSVTLPDPATNVIVGLTYSAQLQTLYLNAPGQQEMQGRRKTVPACTLRVVQSRGPKIGRTFEDLQEMDGLMVMPGTSPMELVTGDFRAVLMSDWEVTGQVCVQQDYPLPLTVLGIIPEFVRGDTAT